MSNAQPQPSGIVPGQVRRRRGSDRLYRVDRIGSDRLVDVLYLEPRVSDSPTLSIANVRGDVLVRLDSSSCRHCDQLALEGLGLCDRHASPDQRALRELTVVEQAIAALVGAKQLLDRALAQAVTAGAEELTDAIAPIARRLEQLLERVDEGQL